jgi:hypothetical protein
MAKKWLNQQFINSKQLWRSAWQSDTHALRTVVIISCILISTLIGILYADRIYFQGWQIGVWLFVILILLLFLMPPLQVKLKLFFNQTHKWLLILFVVSLALRLLNLENLPGNFHVDEAGMTEFALIHVLHPDNEETINPFRTSVNSHAILYFYILRLFASIGGYTIIGMRLSSVLAGSLAVIAIYFMVKQFSGNRAAWIAAILACAYHFHIHWSRLALNNIWVTLLMPLVLGFYMWGWQKNSKAGAVLSGLFLGLTGYFYQGGALIIFLMIFLFLMLRKNAENRKELWHYSLHTLIVAWVVAAPIIIFAVRFPHDYMDRAGVINGWDPAYIAQENGAPDAYLRHAWHQFSGSFGAFNFYPDRTGFYASRVPFLIGVASPLFLAGILWSLYKKQWMPLVWLLLVTILGGFLLSAPPGSSHFVVAIPAICWVLAILLDRLMQIKHPRWAVMLIILIVITDLVFYFAVYPGRGSDFTVLFPLIQPFTG